MRLRASLVVLVTVALLPACTDAKPRRTTHPSSAAAGLVSQRFVYSVEEDHGESGGRGTLVIDVADPYVARVVTQTASGTATGSAWGAAGLVVIAADGSARQVQQAPPGFTGGDSRLDVALPLAASLGWVRKGSASSVAGRACTTWLSGPPLDSGTIGPPTPDEQTSSCVDDAGRIVSDTWTRNGRTLRVRRLTSTGPGPLLSADGLDAGHRASPLPSGAATQLVRAVPAAKLAPLMGVALPAAPPGQRLDRSTALETVGSDGAAQQEGASFTYVGDNTLTVVTFTRYLVGAARAPTRGQPVRLARGTGRVAPVVEGLEADLVTRTGIEVKVQTDLPLTVFTQWLQQLTLP